MVWAKGQSGNPGGITAARRAVVSVEAEAMAAAAPNVRAKLLSLIDSPDDKVALGALKLWLDRFMPVPKGAASDDEKDTEGAGALAHFAALRKRRDARLVSADSATTVDVQVVSTLPQGAKNQ
jgi:hypothetical protein